MAVRCLIFTAILLLVACGTMGHSNMDTPVDSAHQGPSGRTDGEGVTGRVTDAGGRPIAGAFVHPVSMDHPSPAIPEVALFTDDDGEYTWMLPPGNYKISVSAEGYVAATKQVRVRPGLLARLDFQLGKRR